jgi:L-rhamnose-H+ transport protein
VSEPLLAGLTLVLLAGLFQGSFMLPSKWMAGWVWENYWLIFAFTAYLLCPWLLGLATVPHLVEVYGGISVSTMAQTMIFGAGWGLGALAFGLGIDAVGMALGYAIILGIAATAGTLIPLAVLRPPAFSLAQALATASALILMLAGVAICSLAGRWKESEGTGAHGRSYRRGVLICVASGLLSSCGNLGFAFGAEISQRAQELGAGEAVAPNAIWTLLAFPLFLMNGGYSFYLLRRNGTLERYRAAGSSRRIALAVSMGLMWMLGMALYGAGARTLGHLGPSFGWAILMCAMVLVSNALGMLTGEWTAAPAASRRRLRNGIAVLVLAICVLGYANHLGTG